MKRKFIFISGLHRSGTTLLFKILRDHPDISGFHFPHGAEREHEGQHNQNVIPKDPDYGGVGYFAFNQAAHLTENSSLKTEEIRARLWDQWAPHWDLDKKFLLEKSPPNITKTRFLQALFPDSFFITIFRHPIATSLATLKWMGWPRFVVKNVAGVESDYSVRLAVESDIRSFMKSKTLLFESLMYTLLRHWELAHQIYGDDEAHLGNKLNIRYEDLVGDPARQLRTITSNFLGLSAIKSKFVDSISNHNSRYYDKWLNWPENELTPAGREFLRVSFCNAFERYGYSFDYPWISEKETSKLVLAFRE